MKERNQTPGTVMLDNQVFNKLLSELIDFFSSKYKIDPALIIDYQLYGFNNYDEDSPSLKKMVDEANNLFLNGKYLYNKWRQYKNGARFIKLSREYSYAYFHCLGYMDVYDFLDHSSFIKEKDKKAQLALLGTKRTVDDQELYVGYYIGETKAIIKTKLTFSPSRKEVEWILCYWESGNLQKFEYYGTIVDLKSNISIFFRKEISKTDRDVFMCIYYGHEKVFHKPFLKGIYTGYDSNDRPVTGEIIFQRVNSTKMQEQIAESSEDVDPIIENYLISKRLVIDHHIPQNLNELSSFSAHIGNLYKIIGEYEGVICFRKGNIHHMAMILSYAGKVSVLIDGVLSYEGYLHSENKDPIFSGKLTNSHYDFNLFISLLAEREEKVYIIGDAMGSIERGVLSTGRFCMISRKAISNKFSFQNDITQYRLNDKTFEYSDIFRKIIGYTLEENTKENPHTAEANMELRKLIGEYSILFYDEEQQGIHVHPMHLLPSGEFIIEQFDKLYAGNVQTFSSGILALNITQCNMKPYFAQVLLFVGGYSIHTAKCFKGTANFLDNELKPSTSVVYVVPASKMNRPAEELLLRTDPQYGTWLAKFTLVGIPFPS